MSVFGVVTVLGMHPFVSFRRSSTLEAKFVSSICGWKWRRCGGLEGCLQEGVRSSATGVLIQTEQDVGSGMFGVMLRIVRMRGMSGSSKWDFPAVGSDCLLRPFAMSLIVSWLLRDFAGPLLAKIPWINTFTETPSPEWFATQAVLRVSLGNFLFFVGFAVLMIGVKDQREQRDSWHHGGWMVKIILWCITIILMFFLPNGLVNAYGSVSRFGSGLFLLIQVVILLDFTHNWNAAWVAKDEQFWYIALLCVSVGCYLASFVFSGFLFHWFTPSGEDCELNTFVIVLTLILGVAFAIISLHPQVNGSLLPAGVIAAYCTYLCYSALSSEPRDYECNGLHRHVNAVSKGTLGLGMLTTLLSVVYSAVRAGSSTTFLSPPSSPTAGGSKKALLSKDDVEGGDDSESDDDDKPIRRGGRHSKEPRPVTYVYSFFHLIFALASMYSAMLLTGWGNANMAEKDIIDVGWPSVWVRIITQWITAALYIWSLVAPQLFPDRDFS